MDPLLSIPGLGGFLATRDRQAQTSQQQLSQLVGLAGLLHQQEQMQMARETAPLQRRMLEAQAANAENTTAQARDKAQFFSPASLTQLGIMSPGQTPGQGVTGGMDEGATGQILAANREPTLDLNKLVQQAAARGYVSPETLLNHQNQYEERKAAREQRLVELRQKAMDARATEQDRLEARREMAQMQIDARADMMRLAASLRPPHQDPNAPKLPAGFRWKADGTMEAIPGGPADVKTQAAQQRAADATADVEVSIAALRDAYRRLEEGGGITSTEKSAAGNIAAAASSSPLGQLAGKTLGTKNQSARNEIEMMRPALLASLMKATGMSSKQMDSNAELRLWLQTATNPTLDVEANRKALDNIERKYLRNTNPAGVAQTPAPAPATDQFEIGKIYVNPKGQRAKYLGNGQWGSP